MIHRILKLVLAVLVIAGFFASVGMVMSCKGWRSGEKKAAVASLFNCPMHPNYFSERQGACPICGMKLVLMEPGAYPATDGAVKMDPAVIQNMGVKTEPAMVRELKQEIRIGATIEVDENRVNVVSAKAGGRIERLHVATVGVSIEKGGPLFDLYSPELVGTQKEYLQALKMEDGSAGKGGKELLENSRRRLLYCDIPQHELDSLEKRGEPLKTMTLCAPVQGVVIEKMAAPGQNVAVGTPLFKIADLSVVWAVGNIYRQDLPFVKEGQDAEVEISNQPGKKFMGTVELVSPVVDQASRTVPVRISLINAADFPLKPKMLASVKIASRTVQKDLSVSEQAVIRSGKHDVAVRFLGNGYFKPVEVRSGLSAGDYVQILTGLKEGDVVVTSSQLLIDSVSNLKAAAAMIGDTSGR